MDPKVFFETSQTKSVSGNATDMSGETSKQAGKAFKEAFNAANAAGNVDPKATTSAGNVDPQATTLAETVDPKANTLAGNVEPKATTLAETIDSKATASAETSDSKATATAEIVDPKATVSAGTVDSKVITSAINVDPDVTNFAENPEPKAAITSGELYFTATTNAGNGDSLARDLTVKVPINSTISDTAQPLGHGKSLPHTQETGNFGPSEGKLDSDLAFGSKTSVNDAKSEVDSERFVVESTEFLSAEAKDESQGASDSRASNSDSSAAKLGIDPLKPYPSHTEFGSEHTNSKTDKGSFVTVTTPQGLIEISLPNGPASFRELAEFVKSQSLPSTFATQVLSSFREDASSALNDLSPAEQVTAATRVFEVDAEVDPVASGVLPNAVFESDEGAINQIEKLASSTIFINKLASSLAPKSESSPSTQRSVEIDLGEVAALIRTALFSTSGSTTDDNVGKTKLSNEAIQIRSVVIDAISSDKSIKLSDVDVNKLATLLEPKFFSAVSPGGGLEVKTRPQVEAIRAAQIIGANSFWSLNDNGDLTTSKVQLDAEYRFGISPAVTGASDRPRQIELDSSIIAAQKLTGSNPEVQGSAQGKVEILEMKAPKKEKAFTSSDALNLRNFAHDRGADDASTVRPLSSNPIVAPVSSESQSFSSSAAPLTNSVGNQGGLNYFAANGTGYPLGSSYTSSEGFRATQYKSNVNTARSVVALSERFSQVLTERLVQNVKSGNYNLRFNVHPRELGAVDIAMELRDGRLDAQISSNNPVTRDLLSESLPRLRDALQAGGLQLSNLEVNDNARDNQKRGLMSSHDHDDSAVDLNETASNLLVEDLTLDAETVDYLA